jgi:2-oxoisovalerate dehydrogenase E1 component alpha subunit
VGTFEQRRRSMAIGETRAHHEALGLDEDDLRRLYYHMLLARRVDERSWILNRQGKAAFVISCQGQEAPRIGAAYNLRPGHDYLYPTTATPA